MTTRLVLIHALSPLHAGTGQAVGAIDLPIARERPTSLPLVPGSSIKGALRARDSSPLATVVFGPDTKAAADHAGAVQFSDAHLILLPVRSLAGTFAWTTSPYLLSRLGRDAREEGLDLGAPPPAPALERCTVLGRHLLAQVGQEARVVLEDLDFSPQVEAGSEAAPGPLRRFAVALGERLFPAQEPADAAARQDLGKRLCLVHDDVMSFLLETATEVTARVRLSEDTKTVAKGALWYEEALPAESVLAGLVVASRVQRGGATHEATALLDHVGGVATGLVQLGGKATVGRGSCRVLLGGQP